MNLRHAPTTIAENPYSRNAIGRSLHGRWLVLARIIWIALVVLTLAIFIASIPAFNATLHNTCTTAACNVFFAPYTVKQI